MLIDCVRKINAGTTATRGIGDKQEDKYAGAQVCNLAGALRYTLGAMLCKTYIVLNKCIVCVFCVYIHMHHTKTTNISSLITVSAFFTLK